MTKHQILKQHFGYDTFRDGQETLIDSILEGQDTLGIMPTGAGKSACYQIPALLLHGITLVISPLISLMKDQVKSLNEAGIHAAYLNSSLTEGQYQEALRRAKAGQYKIIYVAPERLMTERFFDFAKSVEISMVTVDEAHCISQWGQDFRPSYLKIVEFITALSVRPIISAFTATATKTVKEDIVCILGLQNATILTSGFDRSNLFFSVVREKDNYKEILRYVAMHEAQSGIIYCNTRKNVEEVCDRLMAEGFAVTRYHGGLSDQERQRNQDDFIYDIKPIMVATNAFGMGIDKSNVRYVLHYNLPKNMEGYYQEAGRAGRDGEPAECILYYQPKDVRVHEFMIDQDSENEALTREEKELVQEQDRIRLRKMTYYCFTQECLRDYILQYFGEYGDNYCGNCSNCLTQFEEIEVTEIAKHIIECVATCGQRYGVNVIIDTLHGANTAKIRQYRMNENPQYNTCNKVPTQKLRQIVNHLLLNGYLQVTTDEYMLLKLTKDSYVIADGHQAVIMKMSKEQETQKTSLKKSSKSKGLQEELSSEQSHLFERLRELRREIAKKEHLPPYIIFSDKTLVGMCIQKPSSQEELLNVSGVGEHKCDKYGQQFLQVINT